MKVVFAIFGLWAVTSVLAESVSTTSSDGKAAASTPPRVGDLAPDFKLAKLDGSSVRLSDFRGQRVLINSWASW